MANKVVIDWAPIKSDYISNPQETLTNLAVKYDINYGTLSQKANDDKWTELREETQKKAQDKTIEKLTDKIAAVNARHANLGIALQNISVNAIKEVDEKGEPKIKAKSVEEVRLLAQTGVEIERKALNIEKEGNTPVAIQINFGSPEVNEWST